MKPNIGRIDAYCRITMGLVMLACSTAKLARKPMATAPIVGAILGGMKVAEGVTRFCPLVCLANELEWKENSEEDKQSVVNPS